MAHDLDLLTGPEAGAILATALGAAGAEIIAWRPTQVDHQPQRGSTAAYRARVRWRGGRLTTERLGAFTGQPPAGALVVGDGDDRVAVWRLPHDPYLPGLARTYDETAVADLVRTYGLGSGPVRLTLRAYRPRRRAVVEAVGTAGRLFLKVVRPGRVASLHERHRLLTAAGMPVAPSLGFSPDGVLVLQALPGMTLREALCRPGAPLPSGDELLALLDRLPAELADGERRRSWLDKVGHYAAVVGSLLPAERARAVGIAAAITAEAGRGDPVAVHGDFYENQIRVQEGRITGLLDVDTAGPGERLDDLACLLGHLAVLRQLTPQRSVLLGRLGGRYLATFERTVDSADLRYRIAAVVLSLATGPHRVQQQWWRRATQHRLDLAERWLDSARALRSRPIADERLLTTTSGPPHADGAG